MKREATMAMALEKIISGGQTGAGQAAIRAAFNAGIPTGGWAAHGWMTEDGPALWLAHFGLVECQTKGYPARTHQNVRNSDGTVCFEATESPGSLLTYQACERQKKPFRGVLLEKTPNGIALSVAAIGWKEMAEWILSENIRVLNVAGNRESKAPGIGKAVEFYLARLFAEMRR